MMDKRRTLMLTAEAAIEMWHASRVTVTKTYEMDIADSIKVDAMSRFD